MESKNVALAVLSQMLPHIEAYGNSANAKPSLDGFNSWMISMAYENNNKKVVIKPEIKQPAEVSIKDAKINNQIASGIGLLNRFAKWYAKHSFENSLIQSIDEFTYLATLQHIPTISKTELIDLMVHEKSTGTEIIKRLITNKLIAQKLSAVDKRSKLVSITPKGQKVVQQLYPALESVSNKVVGNLSNTEKKVIKNLIEKLESFHREQHKK
jgi:MarR family transcriptional regulator, lower aerobic nicotinate degradation pathway regulator